jgi:hypothetical protein
MALILSNVISQHWRPSDKFEVEMLITLSVPVV